MFKVALVLLLAHSAWGQTGDEDQLYNLTVSNPVYEWQRPCGEAFETDGCTYNPEYWETHSAVPGEESLLELLFTRLVPWPNEPLATVNNLRYCFDFGRYAARSPKVTNTSGLVEFVDLETIASETACFMPRWKNFQGQVQPCTSGLYTNQAYDMTYLGILKIYGDNIMTGACIAFANEYVAALLNRCNRACAPDGYEETMIAAAKMIFSVECFGNEADYGPTNVATFVDIFTRVGVPPAGWEVHYEYLKNYNSGRVTYINGTCAPIVEPGYCYTGPGILPKNANVTCIPPATSCDRRYECEGGCTHSQGYWKNHRAAARLGKKKQKQTVGWDDICPPSFLESVKGNSTTPLELFPYFGDLTWGSVLDTSPKGDACIIAAKQVIAAQLNIHCQMACVTPEIASAIAVAEGIMAVECPGIGNVNSSKRELLAQAKYIEGYNTGWNGPGDCSDITLEAATAAPATAKEEEDTITGLVIGLVVLGIFLCCLIVGVVYYMGKDEKRYKGN